MFKQTLLCCIFSACLTNIQASGHFYLNFAEKENTKVYDESIRCISKLAKQSIPCGDVITTVSGGSFDNVLKTLNNENCHNLVTRSIQRRDWLITSDGYLILLNSGSELTSVLFEISKDLLWDPEMKFIIAVDTVINNGINKIFNELLKYRIYSVVVISFTDSRAYTYLPFANNSCGKNVGEIINLDCCNNDSVVTNDIFFHNNDLQHYRNCPIVVAIKEVFPYAYINKDSEANASKEYKIGIEQLVMDNIAKLAGVEIKYKYFPEDTFRGVVLANTSATGILSYLQTDEVSAVMGGYTLIQNRMTVFDCIWGYNYATFKMVIRAPVDTVWKKVYKTFSIQSWSLIVTSLCIMYITTLIILIVLSKKQEEPLNLFLKLLDYFLDHSDQKLFSDRNLRLLLLLWIWYTYFINSFYKTAFYSLITGHVKEKFNYNRHNLTTFPFKPCVSEFGARFFLYAYNVTFPNLKWVEECQNAESSFNYIEDNPDYYAFATEYAYFQAVDKHIDSAGNLKLDSWEIFAATVSTIYCNRGFPLRVRFQQHAMRIFESGITKYQLGIMKANGKYLTQSNNQYFENMSLGDFVISYYILLVGSIISFICFLFERCYKIMSEYKSIKF